IIAAIQAETDKAGYQMFILYAGNHNARLLNQAISVALERHVAGILLVATSLDEQAARTLQESNTPCRLVSVYDETDSRYIGFKFTSSNNEEIGYSAANYLIERGHSRIGLAGIDRSSTRSEEHTSELQSRFDLVCRLLLEKKNKTIISRLTST